MAQMENISPFKKYIASLFNANNCPEMIDKPKIFVIQACRGDRDDQHLVDALFVVKDKVASESIPSSGKMYKQMPSVISQMRDNSYMVPLCNIIFYTI